MMSIGRGDIARGYTNRRFIRSRPMEDEALPQVFGAVVRELRRQRGLSQERFAAQAGMDRAYMGGLERGERNPSLTTIARVARGLDMSISDVMRAVEEYSSGGGRRRRGAARS